ncbi:putative zinc alcohol dehydrogenase [Mollisia scopiformis]|uniref:Putative zinc alcohol dehydrogenase n=1 Tax=Mollisia scopiformis TaxID=149040 RepID=A0A194WTF6_MOLSC|nr:putative zinc alcohol dehydrogenase [Mollisia scopiformis]KUJ10892.1 putative zinc alcohol dehydrogenase [Mollisia scopiformis]
MAGDPSTSPNTMRAWLWTSTAGGLEKNLQLSESATRPGHQLGKREVLVQVISMSLNPADYRVPEIGLLAKLIISTPSSPGIDFSGRVVDVGSSVEGFMPGSLVFGCLGRPTQFGPLAEYLVCSSQAIALLPEGVDLDHAACIGVAGQTALQVIKLPSEAGDRIFINGGSGGCGLFCIQIAKLLGWNVTVTCSTRNISLCKELGADEVIDYTAMDTVEALKEKGAVFGSLIDNVGTPENLYRECHHFLRQGGSYSQVNIESIVGALYRLLRPSFLGGGKRKIGFPVLASQHSSLVQLGKWMQEDKIKAVIDSMFEFEEAVKAYEKLKTHRARGKIIVHVSKKP